MQYNGIDVTRVQPQNIQSGLHSQKLKPTGSGEATHATNISATYGNHLLISLLSLIEFQ